MLDTRPVNLNLFQLKFPVMAIVSILHRISGVFIFLMLPFVLWSLGHALHSAADFQVAAAVAKSAAGKAAWMLLLCASFFHVSAGLRHVIMDLGFAESHAAARITAYTVIIIAVLCGLIGGYWLW